MAGRRDLPGASFGNDGLHQCEVENWKASVVSIKCQQLVMLTGTTDHPF